MRHGTVHRPPVQRRTSSAASSRTCFGSFQAISVLRRVPRPAAHRRTRHDSRVSRASGNRVRVCTTATRKAKGSRRHGKTARRLVRNVSLQDRRRAEQSDDRTSVWDRLQYGRRKLGARLRTRDREVCCMRKSERRSILPPIEDQIAISTNYLIFYKKICTSI